MKKRLCSLLLFFCMVLSLLPTQAFAVETVQIASESDLTAFAQRVNSGENTLDAVVTADITIAQAWTPMGTKAVPYQGTFNGGGYTITLQGGMTFIGTMERYGLFNTVSGTIRNLTVAGTVDLGTKAGNVGGIAGFLESGGVVKNCLNTASVSGKNNIGGIVGMSKGTVSGCANRGAIITTNSGNSGGVVGMGSSGSTIDGCYNSAEIYAKSFAAGGIVGNMSGQSISNCYNTGAVSVGTKNAGGIAGQASSYSGEITMQSVYNAGKISGGSAVGAITGMGRDTTVYTDVFYVEGTAPTGVGNNAMGGTTPATMPVEEMKTAILGLTENGKPIFAADDNSTNDGWPVLAGQSGGDSGEQVLAGDLSITGKNYIGGQLTAQYDGDEAVHYQWYRGEELISDETKESYTVDEQDIGSEIKVTISAEGFSSKSASAGIVPNYVAVEVTPAEAVVMVKDSEAKEWAGVDGIYALPEGTYDYTVSMGAESEYAEAVGRFTVPCTDNHGIISIGLEIKTYSVTFDVCPAEAVFTLKKNGEEVVPTTLGTTSYQLPRGEYTYSIMAFGYEELRDIPYTVRGEGSETITMRQLPLQQVGFHVTKEIGGPASDVCIIVRDSSGTVRDYTQGLPAGAYTYAIACDGYQSARGAFTVTDKAVEKQVQLQLPDAWDGVTVTEPVMDDEGNYLIGTAAELFWFGKNALPNANAKLTADITINADMSAEQQLIAWMPIGRYVSYKEAKPYIGTFDGQGHTISGLYIDSKQKSTGFFGFVGEGGQVMNLTVDGSVHSTNSYTGGIAGYVQGTVSNCCNLAKINGTDYVGGVVGDLSRGSVLQCANRGQVTGKNTVGGIAGGNYAERNSNAVVGCYNVGAVIGEIKVGGIIGNQYAYSSGVKNVYSGGSVTATKGYAGGIFGNFRTGSLSNCYTIAEVTGANDMARGKIAGTLEAAGQQKSFSHVYYLDTTAFDIIGSAKDCTIQNGEALAKTEAELKALDSGALGEEFTQDTDNRNGGYPILKWQVGVDTTPTPPEGDPNGWDGKAKSKPQMENGVYQIGTAAELAWFAAQLQDTPALRAVLIEEIDLNHKLWTPMCGAAEKDAFSGTFDGRGHTIKNLYIYSKKPGAALFAGSKGTIQNLTVTGQSNGTDYVAAVVAYNYGEVRSCVGLADVKGGNYVAGVVSQNAGSVSDCSAQGSTSGAKYIGGVNAYNAKDSVVERCFHTGFAKGTADFVGGVSAANDGTVDSCYNTGLVMGGAAQLRSYVSGVVGWNDGVATNLYNTGSVLSAGSYVGGTVGISTTGTEARNLYGVGSVMGMYYEDDSGYEQYYVGAAVGRVTQQVENAYYLQSLPVTNGGIGKSEMEMKAPGFPVSLGNAFRKDTEEINQGYPVLTWQTAANTPATKSAISGTVTVSGDLQSGSTLSASYAGDVADVVFVWYTADEDGEYVLQLGGDTYKVPVNLVGRLIRVKVYAPDYAGFVEGAADAPIEGMSGSVFLKGTPIVGKTLYAAYSRAEDAPEYRWYRGNQEITGATDSAYTISTEDVGYLLKVRVIGNKPGYVEKAMKDPVVQAETAGVWPDSACQEPTNVGGEYVISTEKELHWFVSEVNGGNTAIHGKMGADLVLQDAGWYPIGTEKNPFTGTFDGNGKTVSDFRLIDTDRTQQGFFGNVGGKGVVRNLNVSGTVEISGNSGDMIGGIAGFVEGCVEGCHFDGHVAGHTQVGGVAGTIGLHGSVKECRSTATVYGSERVGGIAGSSSYGDIYYCVNNGTVGGSNTNLVGGIVGDTQNYAVITGCYQTGKVEGNNFVGGISGKIYVASAPLGCYSVGTVKGNLYTGGVVGNMDGTNYIPTVHGSFYLNTLPKDPTATAASAKAMKDESFVRMLNNDAYVQCYVMDNGTNKGYPILKWEKDGHQEPEEGGTDVPAKERITVSFTLLGDTVHGETPHSGDTVTWIAKTTMPGLPAKTTAYDLFRQILDQNGYTYKANGNSYIKSITTPDNVTLGEFTNGARSGWMYTINGNFPDFMANVTLQDGDDMVFFYTDDYTQTGWNPDQRPGEQDVLEVIRQIDAIATPVTLESEAVIMAARAAYEQLSKAQQSGVDNYKKLQEAEKALAQLQADDADRKAARKVEEQIDSIGTVTLAAKTKIQKARNVYEKLTETQKRLVGNYETLVAAENQLDRLYRPTQEEIYRIVGDALSKQAEKYTPVVDSVGGEWLVLGLARSGRDVPAGYYDNVMSYVKEYSNTQHQLHWYKSTDNSRVILALTAIGRDVTNVGGHNLLMGLTDMHYVMKQGINGPIWALIAFDAHDYEIPTNGEAKEQVTREALIHCILEAQLSDGGWALSGSKADVDFTAMALQALAPYYAQDDAVKAAVDKALLLLSKMQMAKGEFAARQLDGSEIPCCESTAQVVVALTALGIDPHTDSRFVKNGLSVIDALCGFAVRDGFVHMDAKDTDFIATEQGYYALAAYHRFLDHKTTLYDMTDVSVGSNPDTGDEAIPGSGDMSQSNPDDTPQTGDTSHAEGYGIVMAGSMLAVAMGLYLHRKKRTAR